jgi:mono/diheme cytochrome c family protein
MWPLRNMFHQQRFNPQSDNWLFKDDRSMRPIVEGTVPYASGPTPWRRAAFAMTGDPAQRAAHTDPFFENDRANLGLEEDHRTYVPTIPSEVVQASGGMSDLLARGRDRFGIYCTPCHGNAGDGQGTVFVRSLSAGYSFPQPASLHQDRLRQIPDGQLFATITNGVRNMPSYAAQIPVQDRWAIVAYVRALQLSQAAPGATQ